MASDEVVAHVGIRMCRGAMLRLGMPREEAEWLRDRDIQVDYRGEPPVVAFIQSPKHWGTFDGIELFETGADDVIAQLVQRLGFDPVIYRPGRGEYYFPDLRMTLWRSCVSDVDGEQGYIFDCVSIHAPGYYDAKTLGFIREQSGLPRLPEPGVEPDAIDGTINATDIVTSKLTHNAVFAVPNPLLRNGRVHKIVCPPPVK